jgi:hypothetical protein
MEEPRDEVVFPAECPVDCLGAASRWVLLDLCGRARIVGDDSAQMAGVAARIGDDLADPTGNPLINARACGQSPQCPAVIRNRIGSPKASTAA